MGCQVANSVARLVTPCLDQMLLWNFCLRPITAQALFRFMLGGVNALCKRKHGFCPTLIRIDYIIQRQACFLGNTPV